MQLLNNSEEGILTSDGPNAKKVGLFPIYFLYIYYYDNNMNFM